MTYIIVKPPLVGVPRGTSPEFIGDTGRPPVPEAPGKLIPEEALPDDPPRKQYVGYRIEKQKYNSINGEWIPLENIYEENLTVGGYYDTKLSYNQYYRYRVYSILRVLKEGPVHNNREYGDLIKRVVELAPETEDILSIYGTNFNAYWIESYPSAWQYIKIVDKKRPLPPSDVQVYAQSRKPEVWIAWIKPINTQKDIVGYNLYKRSFGTLEWDLIFEGGTNDNLFVDKDVIPNHKYIYAVQCVDAHNLKSKLSAQWSVQINRNIHEDLEELPVELYQTQGEDIELDEDGDGFVVKNALFSQDAITKSVVAHKKIVVTPNPTFPSYDRSFIIRVTSLDTDEKHDIKVSMKKDAIPVLDIPRGEEDGAFVATTGEVDSGGESLVVPAIPLSED